MTTTLKGLTVFQDVHPYPPIAHFPILRAGVHWKGIFSGRLVAEFRLDRPKVNINLLQLSTEAVSKVPLRKRGLLRPARVSSFHESGSRDAEYSVLVDIRRFESVPGEGVTIEALWSVRRSAVGAAPIKARSLVREPAGGKGYDALVAAHSRALAAISGDIFRVLR